MTNLTAPNETTRCPHCDGLPKVDFYLNRFSVFCDDCYDGAPDSLTRHEVVWAYEHTDALDQWNGLIIELEPEES